ncbi:phage tail protein I [Novosphingobium pituita]|nr:phage tail protein I [Novosphingobium sp. IK01]
MSTDSLLPPNATPLETGLARLGQRLSAVELPIADLWNPQTCPLPALPWLAWGLAISHWKTGWSVEAKRAAIADAIPYHRRKGTRSAVEEVLGRYHPSLKLIEWHEAVPRREPHTFEVRAPADVGAFFLTPAMSEQIIADVDIAKPARSHFHFVHVLDTSASLFLAVAGAGGAMFRTDAAAQLDTSRDWSAVFQTETGEPLFLPDGSDYLETH